MGVSYKKLFKLLIDRGMKKKDLQEAAGLSPAAVTKLAKDEYVRLDVLVRVCCALDVDIGDIMEVTKKNKGIYKNRFYFVKVRSRAALFYPH